MRADLTLATGAAERKAAIAMVGALEDTHPITLGADKAYDMLHFVARMRRPGVTPHIAQNNRARRSIDGRITRYGGHATCRRRRKRIEEVFGWMFTLDSRQNYPRSP